MIRCGVPNGRHPTYIERVNSMDEQTKDRLRSEFFTPTDEMPPPVTPLPVKRRPGRRVDPSLRALRKFTMVIDPLKKQERDALIRWLVDRYEVQTSPLTWRR